MASVPVLELTILILLAAVVASGVATSNGDSARLPGRVSNLVVTGTRLRPRLPVRQGGIVDVTMLDSAAAVLRRDLVDNGFISSVVSWSVSGEGDDIRVEIKAAPGRRARVASWRVALGNAADDSALLRILPPRGSYLTRGTVERAVGAMLRYHIERGFPLVSVKLTALAESAGWVVPLISVGSGPKVVVRALQFAGRFATQERILARAAGFRPGMDYVPARVRVWRRGIEDGEWARCDSVQLASVDDEYVVRIWITETGANWINVALGYAAGEGLTGMVRIRLLNLMGTGRRLQAGWQSWAGRTVYSIDYTEPWVFNTPVSLTGRAEHTAYDTSAARTEFGLGARLRSTWFVFDIDAGWERTVERNAGGTQVAWAGTGLTWGGLDRMWAPAAGAQAAVRTRVGQRRAADNTSAPIGRFETDVQIAYTPRGVVTCYCGVRGRSVESTALLADLELYPIGGASSVRGYREGSFRVRRAGWATIEPRFGVGRAGYAYPFVDGGFCQTVNGWQEMVAYGVGGRWLTRLGRVGIDYGVGVRESPLRGKVHLSLEGGF